MTEVIIHPGICGLRSIIRIDVDEKQTARVQIASECCSVGEMEHELKDMECMKECFSTFHSSQVYKAAEKCLRHVACPVPGAIIKGLEVACGLALPKDVNIQIKK